MRLEPLREALLAQARGDAQRLIADADREAAATVVEARARAAVLVEEARSEGAAVGAIAAAHAEARARSTARSLILAAERALYDELRERAELEGQALRGSQTYRRLLDGLTGSVYAQLGAEARIELDPPEGGIRASVNGRSVDYTLPALVERALADLGGRAQELWA